MLIYISDIHPSFPAQNSYSPQSLKQKVLLADALKVELISNGQSKSTMLK